MPRLWPRGNVYLRRPSQALAALSAARRFRRRRRPPSLEEAVALYCERTDRRGLPDLNWYFAYNLYRLACILRGIQGRVKEGNANSAHAAAQAARIPPLTDAAYDFAKRAGMR